MKYIIAFALPIFAAVLATNFSLSKSFGAHPQWADTVVLIGTPIGIVLCFALSKVPYNIRAIAGIALTVGAFATARYGRVEFGASFAEGAFAGQLWHYGWIATCVFAAFTLTSLALRPKALGA